LTVKSNVSRNPRRHRRGLPDQSEERPHRSGRYYDHGKRDKNLEQVVSMILNGFQHPHPRVRWAAINAIGQLSTDLGPDLQVQYHQKVLPALANAMDDFQNPRVQASVEILASSNLIK
jgi:hypothetical protein